MALQSLTLKLNGVSMRKRAKTAHVVRVIYRRRKSGRVYIIKRHVVSTVAYTTRDLAHCVSRVSVPGSLLYSVMKYYYYCHCFDFDFFFTRPTTTDRTVEGGARSTCDGRFPVVYPLVFYRRTLWMGCACAIL